MCVVSKYAKYDNQSDASERLQIIVRTSPYTGLRTTNEPFSVDCALTIHVAPYAIVGCFLVVFVFPSAV